MSFSRLSDNGSLVRWRLEREPDPDDVAIRERAGDPRDRRGGRKGGLDEIPELFDGGSFVGGGSRLNLRRRSRSDPEDMV